MMPLEAAAIAAVTATIVPISMAPAIVTEAVAPAIVVMPLVTVAAVLRIGDRGRPDRCHHQPDGGEQACDLHGNSLHPVIGLAEGITHERPSRC